MFAGLSSLGELSIEITESRIVSGVWTGFHRSAADSYPYLSSSGGWRIDIQTSPDGYTTCGVRKYMLGVSIVELYCSGEICSSRISSLAATKDIPPEKTVVLGRSHLIELLAMNHLG